MDRAKAHDDKTRLDDVIGRNIRKERIARKLSRDDFAAIIDLTSSHLGLIERGERGATNVTLERCAKAFNISIDSLFVGDGNVKEAKTGAVQNSSRKKILTLLSGLTDNELEFLSHTVKGMSILRRPDK